MAENNNCPIPEACSFTDRIPYQRSADSMLLIRGQNTERSEAENFCFLPIGRDNFGFCIENMSGKHPVGFGDGDYPKFCVNLQCGVE